MVIVILISCKMETVTQGSENTNSASNLAMSTSYPESSPSTSFLRKQWTREQKIEFIELFKKHNNKAMAAREFKSRYYRDLNSKTYNRWIKDELKIRQSKFQSKKVGSDMEAKLDNVQ